MMQSAAAGGGCGAGLSLPPIARGSVFSSPDALFVEERLRMLKKLKADSTAAEVDGELLREAQRSFDEVIERLPASGKILAKIKREYDSVIQAGVESQYEASMLPHKQAWGASEEHTIRNYRMRVKELQDKLSMIKANNARIKSEIEEMKREREAAVLSEERRLQERQQSSGPRLSGSTRRRLGLSLQEATSITLLKREVQRSREELAEAKEVTEKKYVPLQRKLHLQQQLREREEQRERLAAENKLLSAQLRRVRLAVEAAGSYSRAVARSEVDAGRVSLDDYINSAIVSSVDQGEEDSDDEAEDPAKEVEQEMILDCFEKFNELFEAERYEEAALHAATSPRGVLRSVDTLLKFKRSARHQPGRGNPLLLYCQALMQSVAAYRPPSLQEGLECAHCALEQGEISKLTHWIAQGSLPPSVELGTVIFRHCHCDKRCRCGCKNLACTVFERCGAHQQVSLCLVHQGKLVSFLAYAKKTKLSPDEYSQLLYSCPSAEFASSLVHPPPPYSAILTTFEALLILLRAGLRTEAVDFLISDLREHSLTQAVLDDEKTDWQVWQGLISCLQEAELWDWAVEFVSVLTVKLSLLRAVAAVQQQQEKERLTLLQQEEGEEEEESYAASSLSGSYRSSGAESGGLTGSGYSSSEEETDILSTASSAAGD